MGRLLLPSSAGRQAAWQRAHRPKQCKLAQSATLARLVTHKLQSQWSPEQIAGHP